MPDSTIKEILEDVDKRTSFSRVYVVKTMLLLDSDSMGRTRLMRKLGLKEAPVKTVLKYLADKGVVEPTTRGHRLTDRGRVLIGRFKEIVRGPLELGDLDVTVAESNVLFLVKDSASEIERTIEQRDAAIKEGAEGTTTVVCRNGRYMLGDENIDLPEDVGESFEIEDGDVLIIGSDQDHRKAEEGAIAALLTLF